MTGLWTVATADRSDDNRIPHGGRLLSEQHPVNAQCPVR